MESEGQLLIPVVFYLDKYLSFMPPSWLSLWSSRSHGFEVSSFTNKSGQSLCAGLSRSVMSNSATPWSVGRQAPLSMGILQARILELVAGPFSRASSQPRDRSQVACTAGGFFTVWTTREDVIIKFVQSIKKGENVICRQVPSSLKLLFYYLT